jgi:hypothetical protein
MIPIWPRQTARVALCAAGLLVLASLILVPPLLAVEDDAGALFDGADESAPSGQAQLLALPVGSSQPFAAPARAIGSNDPPCGAPFLGASAAEPRSSRAPPPR